MMEMPSAIVAYPDPVLNKVARPLTEDEIKSGMVEGLVLKDLVQRMADLMRDAKGQGVGLAAPQVGLPLRLFIIELPAQKAPVPLTFVNPELSNPRGSEEMVEGCLSLPDVQIKVKRPQMIHIKAKNVEGADFEIDANGMQARCILHEYDHLDGTLIITRGNVNAFRKNFQILDELERVYKRWQERKKRS